MERASRLPGAVVWSRTVENPTAGPVLPDGCMDLLWNEGRLLVAGPDTRAHAPGGEPTRWAGIRFAPGTAPTYLGVPAHELRDRRVDLTDLWPIATVRRLRTRIAKSPTRQPSWSNWHWNARHRPPPPTPSYDTSSRPSTPAAPSPPPPTNSASAPASCTAAP